MNPYLSIVAVSRNDDHGGDPLIRTQIFVNCLARQCERYALDAELILVDWNPVEGRPGLSGVLTIPEGISRLTTRVVTVPPGIHEGYKCSDKLPLFQMIGKNVGIRRARGDFILATNIDLLFSEELIQFIARKRLNPKNMYRVDRFDIESGLKVDVDLDEAIDYAWTHPIRGNVRLGPPSFLDCHYGESRVVRECIPDRDVLATIPELTALHEDGAWQIRPARQAGMPFLHTNACGDFTLLSREGWEAIRGYAEFEAYSFNIDSMGLVAAHYAGYEEVSLLPPCVCFHIEHSLGSGWTPEGQSKLFERLNGSGILNPEWPVLLPLVEEMRVKKKALEFNFPSWGLAAFDLPERQLGDASPPNALEMLHLAEMLPTHRVGAIRPEYDLDRLTLLHERRLKTELDQKHRKGFFSLSSGRGVCAQLFIPDDMGDYSEQNSLSVEVNSGSLGKLGFSVPPFDSRHPIRFDPSNKQALIEIKSCVILDSSTGAVLRSLHGAQLADVASVGGTARLGYVNADTMVVVATGEDPQLYLAPTNLNPSVLTSWIFEISVLPLVA